MLARNHRFHGYGSLKGTYSRGFAIRAGVITARYQIRGNRPYRVAVVVSKKVHKSAVVRNRIRRRVYEAVRVQNNLQNGVDLILTVFSEQVATQPAAELKRSITDILKKIDRNSGDNSKNHATIEAASSKKGEDSSNV